MVGLPAARSGVTPELAPRLESDRVYRKPYCARHDVGEWWAMQGLNLRPLPCEGSALPLS